MFIFEIISRYFDILIDFLLTGRNFVFRFLDPLVNASPSEDDEDNTEFYDAQESSQHSLNNVGLGKGSLGSLERGRTASQGSDDGSSSEGGDPVALSSDDPTASNYRIVTDNSIHTNELENVS